MFLWTKIWESKITYVFSYKQRGLLKYFLFFELKTKIYGSCVCAYQNDLGKNSHRLKIQEKPTQKFVFQKL